MSPETLSLSTARFVLRPLSQADAVALCRVATHEVARNLASIPLDMTEEMARSYIAARAWRDRPGFVLAIEHQGQLIGGIGMGGEPVSCMYFLSPDWWGQGVATEALSVFLTHMMPRFGLDEIVADHFTDNPASGRVLEKVGFRQTKTATSASAARVETCEVVEYRLRRSDLKVAR